jgi:nucleoside-diphosphate-sugar epimerase
MAGCETVIHTASPFLAGANADPQANLVRPALDGTRNVLETANTVDSVLRVVLTSSVVATYGDLADAAGRTITEDDWNTTSTLDHQPYPYSKTLAEKAAWEAEAAQERWKLVVVNPSFVMGPSLSNRNDGTSVDFMLNNLKGTWKTGTLPMQTAFVDVREVAFAHVEAALRPDAAGRHLLVSEVMSLYAFGQLIEAEHPGRFGVPAREVPTFLARLLGPFLGFSMKYISRNGGHPLSLDNTRSKERLGVNYRPLPETVRDHIAQIERDGML